MKDTKDKILVLAERLIQTKGYVAFSYKDIALELGVKNAAIHYHFPSKEDLGMAIIQHNRLGFVQKTKEWKALSHEEQLKNFIATYQRFYAQHLVCMVGALGASFDVLPKNMQVNLKLMAIEIKVWLEELLHSGLEMGVFGFKETIEEKASVIIAALLSGLILSKVVDDTMFDNIIQGILKTI